MSKTFLRIAGAGSMGIGLLVAGTVFAAVPTLSQTSVTVGVGQSATVTSSNGNVYMLSNSDGTVVSVLTNANQVVVTGQALGGAFLRICAVDTASDCTNLNVTVQAGRVAGLSFNPNNFSLPIGGSQAVAISGGSGTYTISANSSTTVASANLASSTANISGAAAGSASFTVCDSANLCGMISVTVTNGAVSNQPVTFNPANPSVAVGQTLNVKLSGNATSFVILTNTNPEVLQASMSGAVTLSLTGVKSGTDSLVVCATGGDCSTLSVTVAGSGSTAAAASTTTATASTTAQTTVQTTPPAAITSGGTAVVSAAVLAQIQALQNAVAQILAQLQSVQAQLVQLKAQVSAGVGVSAGASSNASVSSGGPHAFTEFLTLNSEDTEVTALQQKLAALGLYSGPITGFYGSLTKDAVMKYQAAHGIAATGYVGPSTRAALNAEK